MSRADQGQVKDTGAAENSSYNTNASDAFKDASTDVGNYADAVGAFKAANPYVQGGTVQTADNQQSADTAAGLAKSAGQSLQSAAVRTGQNAGGAIAATEQMQEQASRDLMGQQAANAKDIAAGDTSYRSAVVGDTGNIETMRDSLGQQQGQLAQGALGTEEQAAQTPSFLDELGQGLITGADNFAGGLGGGLAKKCWIAAELWGGWMDPRTVLVRTWLTEEFEQRWYGGWLCRCYARWGRKMAAAIRTRPWLRACMSWLFEWALRAAKAWQRRRKD